MGQMRRNNRMAQTGQPPTVLHSLIFFSAR